MNHRKILLSLAVTVLFAAFCTPRCKPMIFTPARRFASPWAWPPAAATTPTREHRPPHRQTYPGQPEFRRR